MTRCDRCDIDPCQCPAIATADQAARRAAAHRADTLAQPGVFTAQFAGTCSQCRHIIDVGDLARYSPGQNGRSVAGALIEHADPCDCAVFRS